MATSLEEFQIPLQTQPQQPPANPRGKIFTTVKNTRTYEYFLLILLFMK